MIIEYVKDDILNTDLSIIVQVVNCQNRMGSGVAKAIYTAFPKVKVEYHKFNSYFKSPEELLGKVCAVKVYDKLVVYNLYGQLNYGYDGKKYVCYDALRKGLKFIVDNNKGSTIAIPKIGAGLAGGDWEVIKDLINEITCDKVSVVVYEI